MPFIVLMALTGLVILYAQPYQDLTETHLRKVDANSNFVSYDAQVKAVEATYPEWTVTALNMPTSKSHAVMFSVDDGSVEGRQVFVNQYTGEVLGDRPTGGGLVGLSNRLHGYFNNDKINISLPAVSALWDGEKVMRQYVVGDLVLEVLGVWTLVLVFSGLYIYLPRKSGNSTDSRFFRFRWRQGGRVRWRDAHGLGGIMLFGAMLLTIISGLAWSTYWGPNFTALANKISPNAWTEAPTSSIGNRGDLDRLGNQIPWNTADRPIPASFGLPGDGSIPKPMSLDDIVTIGNNEKMKPGFIINFPQNVNDPEAGTTTYGSFTLSNSWPRKTGEGRDLFIDQFSGETIDQMTGWGYGKVSYTMDTLVSTHMGTQLGLFSRLFMTGLCILSIWSVVSASIMYSKRRRKGTLGLPKRPIDLRLARRLTVTTIVMGVVFPVWGVVAAVILLCDRFLIRKIKTLRVAFGQN